MAQSLLRTQGLNNRVVLGCWGTTFGEEFYCITGEKLSGVSWSTETTAIEVDSSDNCFIRIHLRMSREQNSGELSIKDAFPKDTKMTSLLR